jgi:hypothetical protein
MGKVVLEHSSQYLYLWSLVLEVRPKDLFQLLIITEVLQVVVEVLGQTVYLYSLDNPHQKTIGELLDPFDELRTKSWVVL